MYVRPPVQHRGKKNEHRERESGEEQSRAGELALARLISLKKKRKRANARSSPPLGWLRGNRRNAQKGKREERRTWAAFTYTPIEELGKGKGYPSIVCNPLSCTAQKEVERGGRVGEWCVINLDNSLGRHRV